MNLNLLATTSIEFPNLHISLNNLPKSFSLFGVDIAFYGVIIAFGMLAGIALVCYDAKSSGQDYNLYIDFAMYAIILSVIGARLYYVVFSWDYYSAHPLEIINIRDKAEVVGIDAVGRQGREVDAEGCRAGRHDKTVADTDAHRDVGVGQHILEVGEHRLARQQREALLDLKVGAGGVDDQNIEEEQAQKADEHQHQITPRTARGQDCFFGSCFRSVCHIHLPPFAALAATFFAAFSSLCWALVRPSFSLVREK